MEYATINGISIHHQIRGSGTPLLMFAPGGFGAAMSRWTAAGGKREWQEMDALETLSKHFRTIAYDRREAGRSGGRIEPLSWGHYVLEACELLEHAGEKQALILGSCMGAALATAFAARHPEACLGLYLHWPVGGYRWMMKGHTYFQRHMDFVRAKGFAAVIARAPEKRTPAPAQHKEKRIGPVEYVGEVRAEMRKVAWPTRKEVINSTIIVLIAVVVMTTLIFLFDYSSAKFVLFLFD